MNVPNRLLRTRVNERLERATRFHVAAIIAPAGFGKSSALRDFLQTSRIDAVRCDLRREDGSLLTFVQRLSQAIEAVAPTALAAFPAIQETVLSSAEPVRQLSDWFAEHLKRSVCTIVIDDLHYAAPDPAAIALLADLIERIGERIQWIIATRTDVGLPIASWVAYGRMDVPLNEDDLRFTVDEALATADATGAELDAAEISALRDLTDGWPVALSIALRTRTHSGDLRTASLGTRDMVYRYLAEQVLSGLNTDQHDFALRSSVFSDFDMSFVETLGHTSQFLQEFRSRVAFLHEIGPGRYRYHDLFRDFLEAELRRSSHTSWREALYAGATHLQRNGETSGAIRLFARAGAHVELSRLLAAQGFYLFERGDGETVSLGLAELGERSQENPDPNIAALRAVIDASRGRFDTAEPLFVASIALANSDDLRLSLLQRYALELVRRSRPDAIDLLEPDALSEHVGAHLRAPLLGTLATAYASAGRVNDALAAIRNALKISSAIDGDEPRARLYLQASYVYYRAREGDYGREYAQMAAEIAVTCGLFDVAARAYMNLYSIAYDEDDDPIKCLRLLDKVDEYARKGASAQTRLFASIAKFEIEVERGNEAALEPLDETFQSSNFIFPQGYTRTLLPAQALRLAGAGNFREAADLLLTGAFEGEAPDRRALRFAEVAVYALAAGDRDTGDDSAKAAQAALASLPAQSVSRRRLVRTLVFLCVADLLRGRQASANTFLQQAERATVSHMRRLRTLVDATRLAYRVRLQQADDAALAASLERLRADHFGGFARVLGTLPLKGIENASYAALTGAEREILTLLAAGAATKQIAAKTRRSPHTIDTHIRSICRKLNCSGRREAVALAVASGWV